MVSLLHVQVSLDLKFNMTLMVWEVLHNVYGLLKGQIMKYQHSSTLKSTHNSDEENLYISTLTETQNMV